PPLLRLTARPREPAERPPRATEPPCTLSHRGAWTDPPRDRSPALFQLGVRRDVPAHVDRTAVLRAVLLLGLVAHLHLPEIQRDVFRDLVVAAAAARRDARDMQDGHLDVHLLERLHHGIADRTG